MKENASRTVLDWGRMDASGVTVAVSLYNYARYIGECLDSIAAQDFTDLQLVIVDDASGRDDSLDVAARWMERHRGRFPAGLLLSHEVNRGLAEARNTAFAAAACDAVFVMDADNILFPTCIRKLKRAMDASGADAAYSQLVMFGERNGIGYADYWSQDFLAAGPYIDAMALVRKQAWHDADGYTHLDGGWEDYDFWCKLAEREAKVCYLPELLCRYRVHGASMLHTDSAGNYERLFNLISLRHPWTRLT